MRIVQTFWTAGQDPQKHAFSWLHPEYNLMSWALSCLSLREHYDEVALYTDSEGKRILIDELHLPYTEVNVIYDDFPCLPQHWALAKIKTYSLQTRPFLHVDGDVYVPKPFSEEILQAPLIAQNREIGTGYYRKMMDRILSYPSIRLPEFVEERLEEETVASYNMGIFGGSDLDFIHRYCEEAFQFINENRMNDPECRHSRVWCNILFEQIFLAVMADRENRDVASVLGRPMRDEGYTGKEFCDLLHFEEKQFFHILGGHKRNSGICEMLARTLFAISSERFLHLVQMFPTLNIRFNSDSFLPDLSVSVEMCIARYEDFLISAEKEWREIPALKIFEQERASLSSLSLMDIASDNIDKMIVCRNPYIKVFEFHLPWNPKATDIIRGKLKVKPCQIDFDVLVTPALQGRGIGETSLGNLGHNILVALNTKKIPISELYEKLTPCFYPAMKKDEEKCKKSFLKEIKYMMFHNIISISN